MTKTLTRTFFSTTIAALAVAMVLFFGFLSVPQAKAATQEELQAMIAQLMAQIALLQSQVPTTPATSSSTVISVGTHITTTDVLRIRGAAGVHSAYIATQPVGAKGTVVDGPIKMDGYNWYKVDYATGADGWNVGSWLRLVTDLPDLLGKVVVSINGNPLVTIENINRPDALAKCRENAAANPKSVVRCVWRGAEIFVSTDVKATPRFNSATFPVNSSVVTVSAVYGAPSTGAPVVTGPTTVGKVNWGDGTADETVTGLFSATQATVKMKHTYATKGTFTITLTGLDGKTAVETVKVAALVAQDASLSFKLSASNPDVSSIQVGQKAEVLAYKIEARNDEGGEIYLEKLAVGFVVNGISFNDIVRDVSLLINGHEIESDTIEKVGGKMIATFNIDGDESIDDGDDLEVSVKVELIDRQEAFADRVSIQASVAEYERNLTKAEAEDAVTNFAGMAIGHVHTLITDEALIIGATDVRANAEGNRGEIGDYTVEFEVTAVGEDVYIKDTAHRTGVNNPGLKYNVDGPGEENITYAITSSAPKTGGVYKLTAGETESFELNVWVKSTVVGSYRMNLDGISYTNEPTGTVNTKFDAAIPTADFRTPYVLLQGAVASSVTYTLSDVKSVTKKVVDPNPISVDDEYVLYRIVLNNGKIHEVKVGFVPVSYRDALFRKAGYTGDIAKLIAMATVSTTAGKITSFTATPATVPAAKNGTQEVVLKWVSENTTSCSISEFFEGSKLATPVSSNQPSSGSLTVKPMWPSATLTAAKHYVVRCQNAVEGTDILVKLQPTTTPVATAPGKNIFNCDRSVATKQATGTLACYGMWDYGEDFGGDVKMCGSYDGKIGCVIQTPVCASGAAKATAYISSGTFTTAQLATISARLKVTPDTVKSGVAGLWEYKCTAPITAGAVLGASTDIYSEIGKSLQMISELLKRMK